MLSAGDIGVASWIRSRSPRVSPAGSEPIDASEIRLLVSDAEPSDVQRAASASDDASEGTRSCPPRLRYGLSS